MIRHRSEVHRVLSSGRLDSVVSSESGIPRSVFSLPSAVITLNGEKAKKSAKVHEGDTVSVEYDEEFFEGLEAEDIPLHIIYEDDSILVIDKEQGMVVHPGSGVHCGTLVNALISRYGEDFASSDDERPGIVHRLDKDTSGVMVIARTPQALSSLQKQFAAHTAEKHYAAIVKGMLPEMHGFVDLNIERDPKDRKKFRATERRDRGRDALTEYTVEKRMMLNGKVYHRGKMVAEDVALNDIVIGRDGPMGVIRFRNYINREFLNAYTADGIIVSTATGSTGYSLSAGGPIVSPETNIMIMTPVSPHTLNTRSIIFPAEDEIGVEIAQGTHRGNGKAVASFDGDTNIAMNVGDRIVIRRSVKDTRIIKISNISFLEVLRTKMRD